MMPDESTVNKSNLQTEHKVVVLICYVTPILSILLMPFLREYAGFFINLRLPAETNYLDNLFNYTNLLIVIILSTFPLIWLGSIKLELHYGKVLYKRKPFAIGISIIFIVIASIAFKTERVQWFFLEAGKVRFEQSSFLRSLTFWKCEEIDFVQEKKKHQLLFLGSSQVNKGVDGKLLAAKSPELQVRVKALPGFSILQYQMLTDDIIKQKPDLIACWISEFDTFREQQIPANRLRYFATFYQTLQLSKLMGMKRLWHNRGQMADVYFASFMTFWCDRDMFKKLILDFWWPCLPFQKNNIETGNEAFLQHVKSLGRNIQQTDLVETNFDSLELFAKAIVKNGIKLYILEGINHPVAMPIYDPGSTFRRETRNRLRSMADRIGFCYVDESQIPVFDASDFADVVHLNDEARNRFTCFLADYFADPVNLRQN